VVTTKRRSASSRSSGRSGSGGSRGTARSKGARPKPASSGSSRSRASGSGRSTGASARSGEVVREGLFWDHAADLCAVGLITLGVLVALAAYGNALGPVGHWLDSALGDLIGVVRFLVPPILVASGAAIIAVRGRPDPVRSLVGALLGLVAVTGLAELAGGRPPVDGSTHALSEAGGWLGALVGRPLSEGLGVAGAAVLFVALFVVAFLLATGISLKTAVRAVVRAGRSVVRWVATASASRRDEASRTGPDGQRPTDRGVAEPWTPSAPSAASAARVPFDVEAEGLGPPAGVAAGAPGGSEAEGHRDLERSTVRGDHALPDDSGPLGFEPEQAVGPAAGARRNGARRPARRGTGGPEAGDWMLPDPGLLATVEARQVDERLVEAAGQSLVAALAAHGVETRLVGRTVGPTVTRFELELATGVKVARVTSLSRDIAYAMASPDVRILAPIPGKSAIGVEVPNARRELVTLGNLLQAPEARGAHHPLEVALGRDIAGRAVVANLADMPHVLISGATGAGKSSCINSLLTWVLMRATPDEVRMILIDPKRVELGQYNDLPHLLTQVVVDPKKAANALQWAVKEMERRYDLLAEHGMRDITGYNAAWEAGELETPASGGGAEADGDGAEVQGAPATPERLPFVLVVVDELNDLMMVAARDVEESVCRIAQMARAVGIHLVLATQRPSVDVITGVIKANIPSRMAFSVSSLADSRVILDQPGAERLIGKGDMLLLTASSSIPQRLQGPWVSESEVRQVVAHWRRQRMAERNEEIAGVDDVVSSVPAGEGDDDELLFQAMELVVTSQLGSTSMLQRKLRVGFARAGRLMDLLERKGVVGPSEGSKARAVLMTPEELERLRS
jgi:DNA segregation ATPase FtsK/SpoIIIE, S-DNA-T family